MPPHKHVHRRDIARHGNADVTGREHLVWNVCSGWAGHVVVIVAGFMLPRMIDRQIGQAALGIWDFGWSVVSYVNLSGIGIGSSVNRYVAKHRASSDEEGIRRTVSSVMAFELVSALAALVLTGVAIWLLPVFLEDPLSTDIRLVRWVLGLLGMSVAVQMAFNVFRGVVTGYHRWDLHNALNGSFHGATVAAMALALAWGGGLRTLAGIHLLGVLVTEITRACLAYRVSPALRVSPAYAEWDETRRMLAFGVKSSVSGFSHFALLQANRILVAKYLGLGALAIYGRPGALIRQVATLVDKIALVLTPTASSLQSARKFADLRTLLTDSSRYGAYLALPLLLGLAILGDAVLRLWMGPRYGAGAVLAILAAGHLVPLTQRPARTILVGLNRHGFIAALNSVTAIGGIALSAAGMGLLEWELKGAALAIAIPLTAGGVFAALYACRQVELSISDYFKRAFIGPICCMAPFAAGLAACRAAFGDRPLLAVGSAALIGATILGPLYWRFALPRSLRQRVVELTERSFWSRRAAEWLA